MTATKFMAGPPNADSVRILDVLNAAYQGIAVVLTGAENIKLEDSPAEVKSQLVKGAQARIFSVTVEEVQ